MLQFNSSAQENLIFNGDFSLKDSCPNSAGQLSKSIGWFQPNVLINFPNGSSDFFDYCAPFGCGVNVPNNNIGYENGINDSSFVGVTVYSSSGDYREYIECKLIKPMIRNKIYCVSYFVSLAEGSAPSYSTQDLNAISNIDAYVSVDSLLSSTMGFNVIPVLPQIINYNGIITKNIGWFEISDTMISKGGEQFITIGNFAPDSITTVQIFSNPLSFSYYFIDRVEVFLISADGGEDKIICYEGSENDSICIGTDSIDTASYFWYKNGTLIDSLNGVICVSPDLSTTYVLQKRFCGITSLDTVIVNVIPCFVTNDLSIAIFPNPNNGNFSVSYNHPDGELLEFKLINSVGQIIYRNELPNGENQQVHLQLNSISGGCYFAKVISENTVLLNEKIIIVR